MRATRAIGAIAITALLAMTSCGTDRPDAGADRSATDHNGADVAFATSMIPHHAQALSMVDLASRRDLDPEVLTLAEEIRFVQAPEIETMVDWLTEWGEPIPETMRDHVNAGHGDSSSPQQMEGMDDQLDLPGMLSAEEMTALETASDQEFEQAWLTMMVAHHEGAIAIATTETTDGRFGPALDLAEDIVSAQRREIEAMTSLLR